MGLCVQWHQVPIVHGVRQLQGDMAQQALPAQHPVSTQLTLPPHTPGNPQQVYPVIGAAPFMVFGADVTHPTSRDESEPSVAAVVGSLDAYLARFSTRVLLQAHRQEVITGMRRSAQELITDFIQVNNGEGAAGWRGGGGGGGGAGCCAGVPLECLCGAHACCPCCKLQAAGCCVHFLPHPAHPPTSTQHSRPALHPHLCPPSQAAPPPRWCSTATAWQRTSLLR